MKSTKLHQKISKTSVNSHNISHSNQKIRKQNFSSYIYQNTKNALCCVSPKSIQKIANQDKYKNYKNFMQSGKITTNELSQRNSFAFQRRKTITPTPRRNSLQHTDRKRLSVLTNYNNITIQNSNHIGRPKSQTISNGMTPRQRMSIKNQIKKDQVQRINDKSQNKERKKTKKLLQRMKIQGTKYPEPKLHQKKINKKSIPIQKSLAIQKNKSVSSTLEAEKKLQSQQQKLLLKLFKGIQFHRDLGKGAHALVKSAVDWNKNRKIAIKIYSRDLLKKEQIKNIEREVEILMSINHQNVIKLYQIIESYKTINLVLEYGGGNSLDQYIRSKVEGRLSQTDAAKIFTQVLKAVTYLESINVSHRDLKSENILLNKHLQVKIIDFGFSIVCKHLISSGKRNNQISTFCGTPTYMAPQVVSKTNHNPHLADRWSLGVLLYTMLNGSCPFKAATQKQLFQKIIQGQFVFISDFSDQAKDLIHLFLKKIPTERVSAQNALNTIWVRKYSDSINEN